MGELRVDPVGREVRLGERTIDLSAKELRLRMLAAEPTRVFTKEHTPAQARASKSPPLVRRDEIGDVRGCAVHRTEGER